jgi:alkaline phosphatase
MTIALQPGSNESDLGFQRLTGDEGWQLQQLRQIRTASWIVAGFALGGCALGFSTPVPDDHSADAGIEQPDAALAADATSAPDAPTTTSPNIVILMIGDGMGKGQLEAASLYRHGVRDGLFLQSLPIHGEIITSSLSGITDSAAAATSMATGMKTTNGRVGIDRMGADVPTVVELAHELGLSAGVVTTASLPHATPGAFTAHELSRDSYVAIADDQALTVQPEVMLGGGLKYYAPAGDDSLRDDAGLLVPLADAGYQVVTTANELAAASPSLDGRLVGIFAADHLDYTIDRAADCSQPTLTEMSVAALDFLAEDGDGFFLVIEGARIDMANHGNDLQRSITETLAFDDAVAAVAAWAADHDEVTLMVTADHESGGLEVVADADPGLLPEVAWRSGDHSNTRVDIYASGPGSEVFADNVRDNTWIHAVINARLVGHAATAPTPPITPDGNFADLRYQAVTQQVESGFGVGFNQLDALHIDADAHGLAIGIEGLFEWNKNAVVILLDIDYQAGTGFAHLAGAISDDDGKIDSIVSSLQLDMSTGFGADFALVTWGGLNPHLEDVVDDSGLRGLVAPIGDPSNLWWYGVATNFGNGVRAGATELAPVDNEGFEAFIPWAALYPDNGGGGVPVGAVVAVAAILVNDDGGYNSNQALPPFPLGTENPGRALTELPGLVEFTLDSDGDGIADGDLAPVVW